MGEHLAHVAAQQAEQLVFDGGQVQLLPAQIGEPRGVVHRQVPVDKGGVLRGGGPDVLEAAQRHAQAGQQLVHGKGLGQVVVRAGVQRVDLVGVLAAGRDDDDGQLRPGADLADDLHAVHVRQAQVQQEDVRALGGGLEHRLHAGCGGVVAVALRLQRGGDQVLDRAVVLNDQNERLVHDGRSILSSWRVKANTAPWGTLSETEMVPPCALTMDLHSARPSPMPRRASLPAEV